MVLPEQGLQGTAKESWDKRKQEAIERDRRVAKSREFQVTISDGVEITRVDQPEVWATTGHYAWSGAPVFSSAFPGTTSTFNYSSYGYVQTAP